MKRLAVLACVIPLAACMSGPQRPSIPDRVIDRALRGAPGEAQPSRVVATELAFARMAREEGQWTAFRAFATSDAVLHGSNGPIEAGPWLATLKDPAEATRWRPRAVWMSCDGQSAASEGRFRDPEGKVGSYVTIWQRQSDGTYKWSYDVAALDDPQPPPRPDLPEREQDEIVVTALDSISGRVADCPRAGDARPAARQSIPPEGVEYKAAQSSDRTFQWQWFHGGEDGRRLIVSYITDGEWQTVLDRAFPVTASSDSGTRQ